MCNDDSRRLWRCGILFTGYERDFFAGTQVVCHLSLVTFYFSLPAVPDQGYMSQEQKILKALVVDDMVLHRKQLTEILEEIPGVDVVGAAPNGKIALLKIAQLSPNLVILDFEMPEMNGIETLRQLKKEDSDATVIMVSSRTAESASMTLEALSLGAYEFITIPSGKIEAEERERLILQLKPLVNSIITRKILNRTIETVESAAPEISLPRPIAGIPAGKVEIVAIGVSTGGPNALNEMIPKLPADLSAPVLVVQHMPTVFTEALAESLDAKSKVRVVEGRPGQRLAPGTVYIAPGGKQMKVIMGRDPSDGYLLGITDDPPENHCQPAADYLFRSVAGIFKDRALGIIMTGMGSDGAAGLKLMKDEGAQVIAQSESTCVVFGMPMEAIKAGVVDLVVPVQKIADEIVKRVG